MALQSTISKITVIILSIIIFLFALDIIFSQSRNLVIIITVIWTYFTSNPIVSWGIIIFILSLIFIIGLGSIQRRTAFTKRLRTALDEAERVTIIDLARKLEVTPAKIELELNRMARSKVRHLPGLLIVSQGKHVYLGDNLLDRIIELYTEGFSRGEIAGSLQIVRGDLDKAIKHLITKGIIEDREEKKIEKVRPSYRRGTR